MLSQSDAFLKERIFGPVAERVKDRRDSLLNIARFPRLGIEGWLKVEATRALLDRVKKILNNGPDIQLDDDLFIELKGATDCNPSWILGGLTRDAASLSTACVSLSRQRHQRLCLRGAIEAQFERGGMRKIFCWNG